MRLRRNGSAPKLIDPSPAPDILAPSGPASRLTSEFTAAQLERITGLTQQHIARVLRGETQPSFEAAVKLATAAGVTMDVFARLVYAGNDDMAQALKTITARRERERMVGSTQ